MHAYSYLESSYKFEHTQSLTHSIIWLVPIIFIRVSLPKKRMLHLSPATISLAVCILIHLTNAKCNGNHNGNGQNRQYIDAKSGRCGAWALSLLSFAYIPYKCMLIQKLFKDFSYNHMSFNGTHTHTRTYWERERFTIRWLLSFTCSRLCIHTSHVLFNAFARQWIFTSIILSHRKSFVTIERFSASNVFVCTA